MRLRLMLAAVLLLPTAAAAQIAERYTYTYITPGSLPDFSDSSFVYNNTFNLKPGATAFDFNFSIVPGAQGINTYGINGTTTSPTSVPDGSSSYLFTVTPTASPDQGFGLDYFGGATGFIASTTVGGRYALGFSGGGTSGVDIGGRFVSSVVLLGDWSSAASHTPVSYGSGYSVLQDFVYDGTNTRFVISTDDFQGTSPGISFSLLGARIGAVPEPATWSMMIVGFGAVGASVRRRRGGTKTTGALTA